MVQPSAAGSTSAVKRRITLLVAQPVDPPLGGRGRQADPLAERGEALPTVLDQQRKNFVIKVVKTQQNAPHFR